MTGGHAPDHKGKPLPGVASVAIQQARYVAKIIKETIQVGKRKPFKYFDKGIMATIGRSKAVVMVGSLRFAGFFAWITWCFIHIVYLIGFRNRLSVMIEWFYHFLTGERSVRLIYRTLDLTPKAKKTLRKISPQRAQRKKDCFFASKAKKTIPSRIRRHLCGDRIHFFLHLEK